ncbi:LysR family transcriptional regulator [Roseovarius azorensis]|nr:LysR family transcriptional regulator [Roseovarius azorensis]
MTLDWQDLKIILHLVRAGTLARAGNLLGINYTTVARRIARAEKALGQPLFERRPDGYRPTELGLLAARHAEEMETREHALMRQLQGRDGSLRGPLVITAPQLLVQLHLVHVIDAFCTAHPAVALQVNTAHDLLDLGRRDADLAVRISHSPGDALTGLRLTEQHRAAFASPDLAGRIMADSAVPVPWIVHQDAVGLPALALKQRSNGYVRMRFDDMLAMIGAAQVGLGVVRMPVFAGRGTPGLVQVPVMPPEPYAPIWVVAHADVWPGARVRAFREMLVGYFRQHRALFTA